MGFVRVAITPGVSPTPLTADAAVRLVKDNRETQGHVFWPAGLGIVDAIQLAGRTPRGHRQVTDAYLLGLALRHGGRLATFDKGMKSYFGEGVELIPT